MQKKKKELEETRARLIYALLERGSSLARILIISRAATS